MSSEAAPPQADRGRRQRAGTTVLVGCRHAAMRELLADLLRRKLAQYEVLEAGDDEAMLHAVRSGRVSVSTLDVRPAAGDIVNLVQRLKAEATGMPVILLIDEAGNEYVKATGADAWLEKKKIVDDLPSLVSSLALRDNASALTYPRREEAKTPFSGDRSVRGDVRDGRTGYENQ